MRSYVRRVRLWQGVIIALGIVLGASVSVLGSHIFADVPTTSTAVHNATEWLFNRGITVGCQVGPPRLYCPDDPVTRAQMALFMQRLGNVFTDRSFGASFLGGATLDPDSSPIVCSSAATPYTPTFPEWANVGFTVGILSNGYMNIQGQVVFSTDGGITWTGVGSTGGVSLVGAAGAGVWFRVQRGAFVAMTPPTTYVFGARVTRVSPSSIGGTGTGADYRCSLGVAPINRNPSTSPLRSD